MKLQAFEILKFTVIAMGVILIGGVLFIANIVYERHKATLIQQNECQDEHHVHVEGIIENIQIDTKNIFIHSKQKDIHYIYRYDRCMQILEQRVVVQ